MDARIMGPEDVKKLDHCEILEAKTGTVNDAPSLGLRLRSLDETIFQLYIVPGLVMTNVAGQVQARPTLAYITKETLDAPDGVSPFIERT